jgi:hypothetical protein
MGHTLPAARPWVLNFPVVHKYSGKYAPRSFGGKMRKGENVKEKEKTADNGKLNLRGQNKGEKN